ncbi:MAG TPA: UDP-N-acetylmuramate dehydrogenase [Planctomycetota bacterium]|nr:UDP-N-acetylmuramate dehydrogenase [Planctomycetota bacterium]
MDGFPILYNEPLSRHVNLRVGGPADIFAMPESAVQIAALKRMARADGLDFRVLGGGTNLLICDEGVRGIVLKLHPKVFNTFTLRPGNCIEVGGAFAFQELCNRAARLGLSGFEKLTGIPGSIGGALRMNAGGKFTEIGERVISVKAVVGDEVVTFKRDECGFQYRNSNLKDHIVVSAVLKGVPGDRETILKETKEFMLYKAAVQPLTVPSAGCFFSNPACGSAGKLIDDAGLKGTRVGGAMVSLKHGNFLYNAGEATAADFMQLIAWVQSRVFESFGVELHMEVQTWGCALSAQKRMKLAA